MKKLLLITLLTTFAFSNNFKAGATVANFQDNEGSGISLGYMISPKLLVETSYNEYYLRAVKTGSTKESWSSYNTSTLGVRYYLKSYANDEIKLFTSVGIEHIYKNDKLSSKTPKLNTYFLAGADFSINQSFNLNFGFGSGGKGNTADKYDGKPSYAHGFITKLALEYNF